MLVLIVAGGGVLGWQLLSKPPRLTYSGKPVVNAAAAIKQAEAHLFADTAHAVVNRSGDKCYFAVPEAGPKASRWNVDKGIYCGSLALLDSDAGANLVHYNLDTDPSAARITLNVGHLDELQTVSLPSGYRLVRPGSSRRLRSLPSVAVPTAPAGPADALVSVDKIGRAKPLGNASSETSVMYGIKGGVKLDSLQTAGYYGSDDAARSAAAGQRLIAFRLEFDGASSASMADLDLTVNVDSAAPRPLPAASETIPYKVISVPTSAKSVDLVLKSDDTTQSISLLTGAPGPDNIKVLTRYNVFAHLSITRDVPISLSGGGRSASSSMHIKISGAELDYFIKLNNGSYVHPKDPGTAYLFVDTQFTVAALPGETYYDLNSPLIELRDSSGHILRTSNVSTDGGELDVFTVPAGFTSGTLIYGAGSASYSDGASITLGQQFQVPVSFYAN